MNFILFYTRKKLKLKIKKKHMRSLNELNNIKNLRSFIFKIEWNTKNF